MPNRAAVCRSCRTSSAKRPERSTSRTSSSGNPRRRPVARACRDRPRCGFDEVRAEQRFGDVIALAGARRVMDEPVRVESVRDLGPLVIECQPDRLCAVRNVAHGLARELEGPAFLRGQVLDRVARGSVFASGPSWKLRQVTCTRSRWGVAGVQPRAAACRCSRTGRRHRSRSRLASRAFWQNPPAFKRADGAPRRGGTMRTTGRHAPAAGAGPCRGERGRPSRSGSST